MALALTPFQAMCGFLPLARMAAFLSSTPEFAALVPAAVQERFIAVKDSEDPTGPQEKQALRDVFSAVMTADAAVFQPELEKLVARYNTDATLPAEADVKGLVLMLNSQFPGDIGVFCAFMLNHMSLRPGEAIFLAAGEPHAYVSGGKSPHVLSPSSTLLTQTERHRGVHGNVRQRDPRRPHPEAT